MGFNKIGDRRRRITFQGKVSLDWPYQGDFEEIGSQDGKPYRIAGFYDGYEVWNGEEWVIEEWDVRKGWVMKREKKKNGGTE